MLSSVSITPTHVPTVLPSESPATCRYHRCQKLLPPRNGKGGPKKEFCSNSCRTQYYIGKNVEKRAAEMIRENPNEAIQHALEAATEEATRPLLTLVDELTTKHNLVLAQLRSLRNAQ